MSRTIGAAFSVRFLNNGDQIVLTRNIVKANGDGASLYQAINTTSGTVTPSWKDASNQPIIQIGARSAAGYPVVINNCTFSYNGTTLSFTYSGSSFVAEKNGQPFSARINGSVYELRITSDLVSKSAVANKQIGYKVDYTSNGVSDTIEGSVDVIIQSAGSDSHILNITATNVELDEKVTSTKLTAEAVYGGTPVVVGSNGYTIKWYNGTEEISGVTTGSLTVTRDMVEGGNLFVAKLYLNDAIVAQDSQRINDIADEYQVMETPTSVGHNFVNKSTNAIYTLSVLRNGSPYSGTATFTWEIFNAMGVLKKTGTGDTVTIDLSCCYVGDDGSGGGLYTDCDVIVEGKVE